MSNTEVELRTNQQALLEARGDVLMVGLGIGLINDKLATQPNVNSVTTIEKYDDIIENTPHNHTVIHRDATKDLSDLGTFDYIWSDASELLNVDLSKLLNKGGVIRQWSMNYGALK
ncbi:hypothetical protein N9137_01030 [Pseudomonadales bacterium]|nr:hypothetical protein [Pseudomonadales bacterium]